MNKKQIRPFGVKDEIGYVFGDMAGSFVNLFFRCIFSDFLYQCIGNQRRMDGNVIFSGQIMGCDQ